MFYTDSYLHVIIDQIHFLPPTSYLINRFHRVKVGPFPGNTGDKEETVFPFPSGKQSKEDGTT